MALSPPQTNLEISDPLRSDSRAAIESSRTKRFRAAIRHHLTNLLIALSAACLCFIRRWYDLERLAPKALGYLRGGPIDHTLLMATASAAFILAAGFWLAWTWVEFHPTRFRRRLGQVVFLLVMLASLESVRRYWNSEIDRFDWGSNLALAALEGLLASGLVLMFFGRPRILLAARRVALLLTLLLPALAFDFTSNVFNAEPPESFADRPNLPMLAASSSDTRLIWLVFDEMDQRFAFDERPAGLELPELDRLRAESVAATHAIETSSATAVALPSLISGRVFTRAQMVDANTIKLWPENSQTAVDWRSQPNIFSSARHLGVNAAIVGWHHPYCRVFGDEVSRCLAVPSSHSSTALEHEVTAAREGLGRAMANLFRRVGLNLLDLTHGSANSLSAEAVEAEVQVAQQQQYFALRNRAYADAANPNLSLIFVHMPTPHMYPIYNRRERNFDLRGARDYFDNLALVDRTLGELRAALEKAGLADRTAVLITSDHGFRPDNWRGHTGWTREFDQLTAGGASLTVPFLLKLPGQRSEARFDGIFSNVVAGGLVLAVLRGEVSTNQQGVDWLARHESERQSASFTAVLQTTALR